MKTTYKRRNGKEMNMQQIEGVSEPVRTLLRRTKPSQIIEIGTASGGFTQLLRETLDLNFLRSSTVTSIDQNQRRKVHEWERIELLQGDCFTSSKKTTLITKLKKPIQKDGVSIIFCDGGDKRSEIKAVAKVMKKGDIVLAHDYFRSMYVFQQEKEKQPGEKMFCSVTDVKIDPCCVEHGLAEFMQDHFEAYRWAIRRKM